MAIGRISGPMLFSNLERQGVDLAFQSNLLYLDVNNLRVGIINSSPQYSLDASGNVKLSNIVITESSIRSNTGVVDLGTTANITIAGGAPNYVLYTDGSGNLSWGQISDLDTSWGNITLANNTISISNTDGNLILLANGTGSVTTTNNFYAGNIYASNLTGNISSNGGSFSGNVVAPGLVGNLYATTANIETATITTGNAETWYAANLNSTNGNIETLVATNFSTGNAVISGGYITSLSNITATTGNVESWYAADLNSTNGNVETLVATNFSTANALISGGVIENVNVQANNFSSGNAVITGGYIESLTNITVTTGNVSSWYAADLNSTNANITTGVIENFSTANAQVTGGNITANITGNVTGTFASFGANVNADWFVGKVDGAIGNFGNVNVNSNLTVTGDLIASGNVVAQKITSPTGDLHISAATNDPNNIIRFDSVSAFDIPKGDTSQRPPLPSYGYVRYNTTLGSIEWWTGVTWIQGAKQIATQIITPNGVDSVYTLDEAVPESGVLININGTVQQPGSAYTISGDQITFAETPQITDIIEIRFLAAGIVSAPYYGGNVAGNVNILANTVSSNTSTGALVVAGGVGIAGNVNFGSNLNIASTTGSPGNTATPANWLKIYVGGVGYYLPLYQ